MAKIIGCPTCHKRASSEATSCPHCGHPNPGVSAANSRSSPIIRYGGGFLLILFLVLLISAMFPQAYETTGSSGASAQATTGNQETNPSTTKAQAHSHAAKASTNKTPHVYGMGKTVHVGYTSYAVWKAWFSQRLSSNPYMNEPPDAAYLFVRMSIRNDDKKARMIPPLKLVDTEGNKYDESSNTDLADNGIGILTSLNPGVTKTGVLVFDVPKNKQYRLKLSGGYWSGATAYVRIHPAKN